MRLRGFSRYDNLGTVGAELTRYRPQAAFAAQLLEIAAMALAKISCILLIERVSPQSRKEKMILFGMVLVYFVYATLAFSLQCSFPRPWEIRNKKCANGGPLVSAIVFNMITDIVLAVWMLPVIRPLNMDKERRNTAAILFGTRLMWVLFFSSAAKVNQQQRSSSCWLPGVVSSEGYEE